MCKCVCELLLGFIIFRTFEQDLAKVIDVLQPGPLGILEHKFSNEDISRAKNAVEEAVQTWKYKAQQKQQT